MNAKLIELAERRALLIARTEHQRQTLAEAAGQWHRPLALADRGISVITRMARHPVVLAGSALLVILLRPRPMLKWAQRSWLAWRFFQTIRRKLTA